MAADVTELAVRGIEGRINDNIATVDAEWTAGDNVAWSGVDFDPGAENQWIRPVVLFAETAWGTHGVQGTGQNVISGILQVSFSAGRALGLARCAARSRISGRCSID